MKAIGHIITPIPHCSIEPLHQQRPIIDHGAKDKLTFYIILLKNTLLQSSVKIPLGKTDYFDFGNIIHETLHHKFGLKETTHDLTLFISYRRRRARCGYSSPHFSEETIIFNHCVSWHKHHVCSEMLKNSTFIFPSIKIHMIEALNVKTHQ